MQGGYRNIWARDEEDGRIWAIWTEPRVGSSLRIHAVLRNMTLERH